jgi:hypothetical protein
MLFHKQMIHNIDFNLSFPANMYELWTKMRRTYCLRQTFMVVLWLLCVLFAVAYAHANSLIVDDVEGAESAVDDGGAYPVFDLDTENFAKYPHPEFDAETKRTFPPKAAKEPAWLQALRERSTHMDLFIDAAKKYNVPVLLLLAIAEQESGHNPWALNIAGQGYKPKSKEDAIQALNANYKSSYDIGLMQVNSYWIRRFNLRVEDVFDPPVNITIAAYLLNECFHTYGTNWKDLGAYHHPPHKNTARSLNYAKVVWSRYLKLENWKNRFNEAS